MIEIVFSSAHFYNQPTWSAEKNRKIFGKCYTPFGHGHNYTWRVRLAPPGNSKLKEWTSSAQWSLKQIAGTLDHEHLNLAVPDFKNTVPTTENITLYLQNKLKQSPLAGSVDGFELFEMGDLWTEMRTTRSTPN